MGGTDTQAITVTVTAVNDNNPAITSANTANVAENTTPVLTVTATDADLPAQTVTYSITGGADQAKFSINGTTGALAFSAAPDYENPTDVDTNNIYVVQVTASDGAGRTVNQTINVAVTPVNDNSPIITSANAANVAENTTAVLTVTATDADLPVQTMTYSITGGADQAKFSINGTTGDLTFQAAPDYENPTDADTNNVYVVQVTANDGAGRTVNQTINVTVTPVNDNDPVITSANTANLAENTTAVLTVTATDADLPAQTMTYSITGGADQAKFSINGTTGALTFSAAPDYENPTDSDANNIYVVQVTASDGAGRTVNQTISVTVTDVDEFDVGPISDTDASADTVHENEAIGMPVGITASAIDVDATNNTITYSLDDNAGGRFAIHSSTGIVTVAGAIDREAAGTYDITVRATSSDTSTTTRTFTITIGDVDEFDVGPVTDTDATPNAVDENAAVGTTVGLTCSASDADATNNTITYGLDDDAGGRFTINGSTGVVTVNGAIDRESAASHTITVRATSADGSFSTQDFTVAVNDVDEFDVGPVSDTDGTVNAVNENALIGQEVGITAHATDLDPEDTITYTLDDAAGGLFAIDSATGVVTVNGVLDYETATSHSITVRATSSDTSFSTQGFTINVIDKNEDGVGPVSDSNPAADTVNENAAAGTAVGITAFASDPDPSDTITYSLDDSAGGRFTIDANTGVVTGANGTLLDRETASSHTITVRATSSDTSFSTEDFTITVNDVDEFDVGPVSDANAAPNSVNENAAIGTTVGVRASATDADATNSTITYSLDDNAGGRFAINSSTGVVTVAGAIDREIAASHSITVRATSTDGSFSTASFTISVNDINEFAVGPISDTDATINAVDENAAIGTPSGITAHATDPDATDTVTYSLDNDAGGRFAIDANTGVITVAGAIDREAAGTYNITVRATSTDTSFSTRTFTITIGDVDEFDVGPVSDTDGAPNATDENAAIGTPVGITASATDQDATTNTITYSLDNNAGGSFAINSSTGVVTVNGALDYETAISHSITVRATSADGSFSTQAFTIGVTPVNDNAPAITSDGGGATAAVNVAENTTTVTTVTATDADLPAQTLTFSISGGADAARFTIGSSTGALTFAVAPDFETPGDANADNVYDVTVRVSDGAGGSDTQALAVTVTSANDAPVGVPAITGTVVEDQILTADTSAISDADGLGAFSYQWLRNGVALGWATNSTYTLGSADVGKRVSVQVFYTDGQGTNEGPLTSAQVGPVADSNAPPTGTPVITGTVTEDRMLTADTSGITDGDGLGAFSYRWLRDGEIITGATTSTHTLGDADVGTKISVQVSYTDGHGTKESLTSATVGPVANVNDAPVGLPIITGKPVEDNTLTADVSGIKDADGLGAFSLQQLGNGAGQGSGPASTSQVDTDDLRPFSYQWLRNGDEIKGATGRTYTLSDADVGTKISVRVIYTDAHSTLEKLTSATVGPVVNVNDAPVGLPIITGKPMEDNTLTADVSGIRDADGLGAFTYQWLRNGVEIGGATHSTYTLGDADVGDQISVRVNYIDVHGTNENLTSARVGPVLTVNYSGPTVIDKPISVTPPTNPTTPNTVDSDSPMGLAAQQIAPPDDRALSAQTASSSITAGKATEQSQRQEAPGENVLSTAATATDFSASLLRKDTLTDTETSRAERPNLFQERDSSPEAPGSVMQASDYEHLRGSLDAVKREVTSESKVNNVYLGSAIVSSIGLSVGYVAWLLRGGMLLASLLSSAPAWQIVDPLPILGGKKDDDHSDDDESLESILDKKPQQKDPKHKTADASSDAGVKRQ